MVEGQPIRTYRPDIQGLRALAVILVIAYHADIAPFSGGFVGVDVFFVISGFVITGYLVRETARRHRASMITFYANRARRILPAASVVIITTVIASFHWLGFPRGKSVAIDGRWASIFLSNYRSIGVGTSYFGAQRAVSPLLHFWSLAVEEQFYLVFPLLFIIGSIMFARRATRVGVPIALLAIIAGSLALSITQTASSPVVAYFSPLTRAWELCLGALLAVILPRLERVPQRLATSATWIGLALIATAALAYTSTTPYPGSAAIVPVLGAALIIGGGAAASKRGAGAILGTWVGQRIGDLSYSLYLWHFPVLIIATQTSLSPIRWWEKLDLLALIGVLSVATYVLVENPIRRSRHLVGRNGRSLAIGAILITGTFVFCALAGTSHPIPTSISPPPGRQTVSLPTLEAQVKAGAARTEVPKVLAPPVGSVSLLNKPSWLDGCFLTVGNQDLLDRTTVPICIFGDPGADRTMVLLGDSQAHMWSTGFDRMAQEQHWKLVVLSKGGCPPWIAPATRPGGGPFPACEAFRNFALREITTLKASAVFVTGDTTPLYRHPDGLTKLLDRLGPTGAKVGVLGTIPWYRNNWQGPDPTSCLSTHQDAVQECNLSRHTLDHVFGPINAVLERSSHSRGADYISVTNLFCTSATCPIIVANRIVYQDPLHMTWIYSDYLGRPLGTLVAPTLATASNQPASVRGPRTAQSP